MAKYSTICLELQNDEILNLDQLSKNEREVLKARDVIYIYKGTNSNDVYIGQTVHFIKRHNQHYAAGRFSTANFDRVLIIFSAYFHLSALDDVERELITYFIADSPNGRKQEVNYNHQVLNRNGGNRANDYSGREEIYSEVILPLWENELYPDWVNTPTLEEIRTEALFKYSPIKKLTEDQELLITEVLDNPSKSYVINGDAGTGKTVLLTHLVASFLEERPDRKIGVVVQANWENTAKNIFKLYGFNSNNLSIMTSTKLINQDNDFDTIIIDESHRLSRKYGKQHPSFSTVYDNPQYEECDSHLEILQNMGKQLILMYDVFQAIRPANITRDMFSSLTEKYEKKFLKTQFRIQAPKGKSYTSDDYINGVKYLLYKDTGLLDSPNVNYDSNFNREVFNDKSKDAYFGYFTNNPLAELIDWVEECDNYNPTQINRILGGLVEPWAQKDGKDATITHWHEGEIRRRWNSTQESWINSKDSDAKEQIGSVFAVQGIDLNNVGVLIGPDLEVGSDGKLRANPDKFHNENGTFKKDEMTNLKNQEEFTLFVMNIYYVLLTRGIDGIRLGFWKNDEFRKYMENTLDIH